MFFKILLIGIIGVSTNTYAQEEKTFQVFFETDSFNLKSKEWVELVQFLKTRDTICTIEIKGYCDDRASQLYNKKLSENRARKVYEQISKYNFCTEYPILFFGEGKIALVKDIDSTKQRNYNRRVDVKVRYKIKKTKENSIKKMISAIITDTQKIGDKITFNEILFFGRMHRFRPHSFASLDSLTYYLKKYPKYVIKINGHVCLMGIKDRNQDGYDKQTRTFNLSETRAKAVYEYLIDKGIDSTRLGYEGKKGLFPTGISCGHDRRVEVEIMDIDEAKLEE